MGYYTYHTLVVFNKDMQYNNKAREEHELLITQAYCDERATEPDLFNDAMKWYTHERDMIEHSLKYPDYVFMIEGEGESRDDLWRQYFYNGIMLTYPASIEYNDEGLTINDFK